MFVVYGQRQTMFAIVTGSKTMQPDRGSNPGPSAYRADVLPTEPPGRTANYLPISNVEVTVTVTLLHV